MQNDLISRSALIEKLEELSTHNLDGKMYISNAIYLIENQPTAYDVKKVVEDIKDYSRRTYNEIVPVQVINIVRRGGRE